jgi:hypothetical protein
MTDEQISGRKISEEFHKRLWYVMSWKYNYNALDVKTECQWEYTDEMIRRCIDPSPELFEIWR